jgi:sec-independent protein translocase protein TatC
VSPPAAASVATGPVLVAPEDDSHLSLREHLLDLRSRVKWAVVWLCVGFLACYSYSQQIFHFLMVPVLRALPEGEQALHYSSATEPFFIQLKVALYGGLFAASPAILWQVWAFIAPGLYRAERRKILPFVVAATAFFLAGAAFCYLIILPPTFGFLIQSAGADIKAMLMMDEQLGLVMSLLLAFGIIFELPLVLTFLAMIGLVDARFLSKYRRHAIVLNTLIAAIVTPTGDPFNLALMAFPMMACYELGVIGARLLGKAAPAALKVAE